MRRSRRGEAAGQDGDLDPDTGPVEELPGPVAEPADQVEALADPVEAAEDLASEYAYVEDDDLEDGEPDEVVGEPPVVVAVLPTPAPVDITEDELLQDDLERGRTVALLAALGRMQVSLDLLERRAGRIEERLAAMEKRLP